MVLSRIAQGLFVGFILLVGQTAQAWTIVQNEVDPFDPSKSTFIAVQTAGFSALGVRCLEGAASLMLVTKIPNASQGDAVPLKMVADSLPVRDEDSARVLSTSEAATSIQFGDESTLEYLRGANNKGVAKISVRIVVADSSQTFTFAGGRGLAEAITKALNACQKPASKTSAAAPQVPIIPASDPICTELFEFKKKAGDLGKNPDEKGYLAWCQKQR